jgi:uncharacterized membrane protein YbhN (UPF0104 family)
VSRRTVRVAFGVLSVGGLVWATVAQWPKVSDAVRLVSLTDLALALALMLAGTYASMLSWRTILADLGSPLPLRDAQRIFFVGQLGKYLPGGLWSVAAQMELGRDRDVPRRRSAAAALLVLLVSLTAAGLVAAATLPFTARGEIAPYRWVFLVPALGIAVLRKTPPGRSISGRGALAALAWAGVQWAAFGLSLWAFARAAPDAPGSLAVLAIGAYALAWSAGFLFLVAPAGAGVREGALALLLGPAVGSGRALGFALVARLLSTVADLAWGGVAVVARGTGGQDVRSGGREDL